MEIAVHFKEEIFCSTVQYYVEGIGLEKACQVDDCVSFPVLRVFFDGAKTCLDVPVVWEWADIHSSRHAAGRTEYVLMPDSEEQCTMASH